MLRGTGRLARISSDWMGQDTGHGATYGGPRAGRGHVPTVASPWHDPTSVAHTFACALAVQANAKEAVLSPACERCRAAPRRLPAGRHAAAGFRRRQRAAGRAPRRGRESQSRERSPPCAAPHSLRSLLRPRRVGRRPAAAVQPGRAASRAEPRQRGGPIRPASACDGGRTRLARSPAAPRAPGGRLRPRRPLLRAAERGAGAERRAPRVRGRGQASR